MSRWKASAIGFFMTWRKTTFRAISPIGCGTEWHHATSASMFTCPTARVTLQDHYQLLQFLKEGAPPALIAHLMEQHMRALLKAFHKSTPQDDSIWSLPLIERGE